MGQRAITFVDADSGARAFAPMTFPVDQGTCQRINLVRYNIGSLRTSVATSVESIMALTPSEELSRNLPLALQDWLSDPRLWFVWHFLLHIGSTSDEAMVEMTREIPIPRGMDIVGDLHLCVLSINQAVNSRYQVEVFYDFRNATQAVRRQLRVKDREPLP